VCERARYLTHAQTPSSSQSHLNASDSYVTETTYARPPHTHICLSLPLIQSHTRTSVTAECARVYYSIFNPATTACPQEHTRGCLKQSTHHYTRLIIVITHTSLSPVCVRVVSFVSVDFVFNRRSRRRHRVGGYTQAHICVCDVTTVTVVHHSWFDRHVAHKKSPITQSCAVSSQRSRVRDLR